MSKRLYHRILTVMILCCLFLGQARAFAVERTYILPSTTCEKAPKSYVFQLKGSSGRYILLDSTDEGYFVLAAQYCAIRSYSKSGDPIPFDPENPDCIAYWLNHDYLAKSASDGGLSDIMKESLIEREYTTEGGGSRVPFSKEYKVNCKIVLLSQTEWTKYNAKFGYADDRTSAFWSLRSVRELTGAPLVAAISSPNSGLTVDGRWKSSVGIRPAFYLSNDFFERAAVDLDNTGDAVISIIRHKNTVANLNKIYTQNEVKTITESDISPMVETVTIKGRGIVGEKITGSYSFVSLDDKAEDGTMYQWQKSSDGKVWSTILGASKAEYVPESSDVGYYIRLKVTPMTGTNAGSSYFSTSLNCKVRPVSSPVASNVTILDAYNARPDRIMDVWYSFYDENRDICSGTLYQWECSADALTVDKIIGTERYCRLTDEQAGKYIRVGVTPKKKTNSSSGRKTVSGDVAYSEWIKVGEALQKSESHNYVSDQPVIPEWISGEIECIFSKHLSVGKTYELWITSDKNGYAYSVNISGTPSVEIASDKYLTTTVPTATGVHIAGTLISDEYEIGRCFKAGEITVDSNVDLTFSGIKTVYVDDAGELSPPTTAKIYIKEK